MKTQLILSWLGILLFFQTGQSQIAVENVYLTPGITNNISVVKLSNSGYKYCVRTNYSGSIATYSNSISLYNLNHTLFKTLVIPAPYLNLNILILYISETLFNTSSSDVEYILLKNSAPFTLSVINESGSILFTKDSLDYPEIKVTNSGTKLTAAGLQNSQGTRPVYVISLPGQLTCEECNSGLLGQPIGMKETSNGPDDYNPFPNPSTDNIKIEYKLPSTVQTAKISFYAIDGKELQTFTVDNHIDFMTINKMDLGGKPGIYTYKIYNSNTVLSSGKIVFE